jgi:hypothetical protein
MSFRLLGITVLAATVMGGAANAQRPLPVAPGVDLSIGQSNYNGQSAFNVRQMDFDLWCQQTQRYEITRCVARRAEDVKAFEDYRTSIERYELDYLKQVRRDQDAQARTNRDPLQNVQGKQDGLP